MSEKIPVVPSDSELKTINTLLKGWEATTKEETARPHTIQRYTNRKGQTRLAIIFLVDTK